MMISSMCIFFRPRPEQRPKNQLGPKNESISDMISDMFSIDFNRFQLLKAEELQSASLPRLDGSDVLLDPPGQAQELLQATLQAVQRRHVLDIDSDRSRIITKRGSDT